MRLRKLEKKDAPLMLEWMHDSAVTKNLRANFKAMAIENCIDFIDIAQNTETNMHLAVVDDCDTYMGTVSLKHMANGSAEFAIAIRTIAMGKGFSEYAMREILRIGFEEKALEKIYWCVDKKNARACRFYDKNGYEKIDLKKGELLQTVLDEGYGLEQVEEYLWYSVENDK